MNGYLAESAVSATADGTYAQLETAYGLTPTGPVDHPLFFSGIVARPDVTSAGLLTVADVAATTYYDLSAIRRSLDPVVTASGDRLRFESFSTCNGVHARFDLLAEGIDSGDIAFGTTNIDVNQPLRTSLANVGRDELLHVGVGSDAVSFATLDKTHVERKVDVPDRWIRGFAETPKLASEMALAFEVSGVEAMRFLASLPTAAPGPTVGITRTPRGLTVGSPVRNSVTLAGTSRLVAARRLMRLLIGLKVYSHPSGASGWVFQLPGGSVTLLVSAAPYRGFSGEGALLRDLVRADAASGNRLLEHLAWQPAIDPVRLAVDTGISEAGVVSGLAELSTSGKVGYDLVDQAWFHRELPSDPDRVTKDNARLVKARELVGSGHVVAEGGKWRVGESPHEHWVSVFVDGLRCSCQWRARYGTGRGPCAHELAVSLVHQT